jgi:hypothetical protein
MEDFSKFVESEIPRRISAKNGYGAHVQTVSIYKT